MYNSVLHQLRGLNEPVDISKIPDAATQQVSGNIVTRATVVRTLNSTAMNVGDKFWVTDMGELIGFTGGSCVRGAMKKASIKVLANRQAALIRSMPHDEISDDVIRENIDLYPSHCPSRGEVDVFLEPLAAKSSVFIVGDSQIARSLPRVSLTAGFHVADNLDDAQVIDFIVIATQGVDDVSALMSALKTDCSSILFVASQKKSAHLKQKLKDGGCKNLDRFISPAGMDIKAKTPGEIAISIVAQMIKLRHDKSELSS